MKFALLFIGNDKVKEPATGELGARLRLKFGTMLFRGVFEGTAALFKGAFEGTVSAW